MVAKKSLASLVTVLTVIAVSYGASLNPTQRRLYDDIVAGRGFYNYNTKITVLNSTNFKDAVFGRNHAWIIEFYNSWCGACQRFASVWKAFAADVYGWRDVVTVAAVDCANDINYSLCREYEIMKYPSLRFLGAEVKPGDKGKDMEKTAGVESIRHSLVDMLKKEQADGRGASWPNISPYRSSDVQNLWKKAPAETRFVLLVFEEPESYVGAELALDLRLPEVQVRYASAQNEALAKLLAVSSYPALVKLERDAAVPPETLRPADATRADFRQTVEAFLRAKGVALPPPEERPGGGPQEEDVDVDILDLINVMAEEERRKKKEDKKEEERRRHEGGADVVHQVDLDLALRYSLGHEVPLAGSVSGAALRALGKFAAVVARLFPASPRGRRQLETVRLRVLESASLDGADLFEMVSNATAPPLGGPRREWMACRGSTPRFRGYPCGLWTLFHTLTVAAGAEGATTGADAGREVLDAVLGYVTHFFGCQECSRHFQDMAAKPGFAEVRGADDAVLWLWRAHNEANARLAGDVTEDPDHPKLQFPSPGRCPDCRGPGDAWKEDRVLVYLKRIYGDAHIVKDDVVSAAGLESDHDPGVVKTGWNFNDFDVSICVLLYVFSAVVLSLAFLKFLVRKRYRKKLYVHDILGKV